MTTEQSALLHWIVALVAAFVFSACAEHDASSAAVRQSAPLPSDQQGSLDKYTEPFCGSPQQAGAFCAANAGAGYMYFELRDRGVTQRVASLLGDANASWVFTLAYDHNSETKFSEANFRRSDITVEIVADSIGTFGYVPIPRFCGLPNGETITPRQLGVTVFVDGTPTDTLFVVDRLNPGQTYSVRAAGGGTQCEPTDSVSTPPVSEPTFTPYPSRNANANNAAWPVCVNESENGGIATRSCEENESPSHILFISDDVWLRTFTQNTNAIRDARIAAGEDPMNGLGQADLMVRFCEQSGCGSSSWVAISPLTIQLDLGGIKTFWFMPIARVVPDALAEPGEVLPEGEGALIDSATLWVKRELEEFGVSIKGNAYTLLSLPH